VLRSTAALVIRPGFFVVLVPLDVRGFHLVRAREGHVVCSSMRTTGTPLLARCRCSVNRVQGAAHDGRGALRLPCLAAVQFGVCFLFGCQSLLDSQECLIGCRLLVVSRMFAAVFAALTALASAVVGSEHGVMVPIASTVAAVTAGAAAWIAAAPSKKIAIVLQYPGWNRPAARLPRPT
jgi:hypothetical protein